MRLQGQIFKAIGVTFVLVGAYLAWLGRPAALCVFIAGSGVVTFINGRYLVKTNS